MAFTFAAICYLLALLIMVFCIFFAVYTVICMDELKNDCSSPIETSVNLNQLILPEYGAHVFVLTMFVLSRQLLPILFNLPLVVYHLHRYSNRPMMSELGIYDATKLLNRDQLQLVTREGWVKIGFYLLSFFYYLYALIYTMVTT
uniref:Cornichon n=1 Tax=Ditylenchus dipsaci TaxID=166011 RepID=A0A915DCN8_9BILA